MIQLLPTHNSANMCVMFVNMSCTYSIFASISSFFNFAILFLSHVSVGHLEWWWCLVCLQLLNLYHCFIFGMGSIVVDLSQLLNLQVWFMWWFSLPPAPQSLGVVYVLVLSLPPAPQTLGVVYVVVLSLPPALQSLARCGLYVSVGHLLSKLR